MGTKLIELLFSVNSRRLSTVASWRNERRCKLLLVGGGAGGCSVAWRFARKLKPRDIIVLEPSHVHYYQPMFTFVASGIKKLEHSQKPMKSLLPPGVIWLKDYAQDFDPCNNALTTACGDRIIYEYMVVAVGVKNDYDMIPGLRAALDNPYSGVCTVYHPQYSEKAWSVLQHLRGGHLVFTFTNRAAKCSGAAQIMYIFDDYLRRKKIRDSVNMTYNTGGDTIFGVKKFAKSLQTVASSRAITVNYCTELAEVTPGGAVFTHGGEETITLPFTLLHVTPPMSPPTCLSKCKELVTDTGYLDVDKHTLQHTTFKNIYGIGDCTSTPNSKTAAAVAIQSPIVERNLLDTMYNRCLSAKYNGYGACTILTSYKKGILAESVYDKKPHQTFCLDQSKERRITYRLKRYFFPYLYWHKLIKGKWNGPATLRKIFNPFKF